MNRADLTALIQNLTRLGITTPEEKLIAIFLTFINNEGEPLQQCEIIEILNLNKKHCREALEKLTKAGTLRTFGRKAIFYTPAPLEESIAPLKESVAPPKESVAPLKESVAPPKESVAPLKESVAPPKESSPAHVNMLTLVNSTELNKTNKQGFEDSKISQAKAFAQGTGTDTDVRRTSVADSAFSAQSPNPLPKNPPATHKSPTPPKLLINEELHGTVFKTDNPLDSLHQMLENLRGLKVPDPAECVFRNLDTIPTPKHIPAQEAFVKYIEILWAMLKQVPNGTNTNDFLLHRAAYSFVMDEWHKTTLSHYGSPDLLIAEVKRRGRDKPYNVLAGILKDLYLELGYGWDSGILANRVVWAEAKRKYGLSSNLRRMFPSQYKDETLGKRIGASLLKQSGIEHQAAVSPADNTKRTLISSSVGGVCCPPPDTRHPILQSIADEIGEEQFAHRFAEVSFRIEKKTAVFVCRNVFQVNALRSHYIDIIKRITTEQGFIHKLVSGAVANQKEPQCAATD